MKIVVRFIQNVLRFLFLCVFQSKRLTMELKQTNFWFSQAMLAAEEAKAAKTQKELDKARQRFDLYRRRYYQHHKYICP